MTVHKCFSSTYALPSYTLQNPHSSVFESGILFLASQSKLWTEQHSIDSREVPKALAGFTESPSPHSYSIDPRGALFDPPQSHTKNESSSKTRMCQTIALQLICKHCRVPSARRGTARCYEAMAAGQQCAQIPVKMLKGHLCYRSCKSGSGRNCWCGVDRGIEVWK